MVAIIGVSKMHTKCKHYEFNVVSYDDDDGWKLVIMVDGEEVGYRLYEGYEDALEAGNDWLYYREQLND
jgi:hypothetical protein